MRGDMLTKASLPKACSGRAAASAHLAPRQAPCRPDQQQQHAVWRQQLLSAAAGVGAAALLACSMPGAADAARSLPPKSDDPQRCELSALDKFADTRAAFSLVRSRLIGRHA